MKSIADVALVTAASLITVIGIYSFSLGYQIQTLGRDATDRTVVESISQMEFVKTAIDHSIIYSTDQGAYDTLNGKYDIQGCSPQRAADNIPFWRTDDKTCTPSNLETSLSANTQSVFNEYYTPLKAISSKIKIIIPSYQLKFSTASFTVEADADKQLEFKTDTINIKDVGDRKFDSGFLIKDYIDTAKEKFINQDPIKGSIISTSNSVLSGCKTLSSSKSADGCVDLDQLGFPSKSQLLNTGCPNILERLSDSIVTNVNGLTGTLDTSKVHVTVQTSKSFVKTTVDSNNEDTCSTGGSCACVKMEDEEYPCTNSNGQPDTCTRRVCTQERTSGTKTCTYDYKAGADALVSISNKFTNKVPVYDSLERKTTQKDVRLAFWNKADPFGAIERSLPDRRSLPDISLPIPPTSGGGPSTSGSYVWPVDTSSTTITSCLGQRTTDYHTGVDIAVPRGTDVHATTSGTVVNACKIAPDNAPLDFVKSQIPLISGLIKFAANLPCGTLGNYIQIHNDDGYYTLYLHLNSVSNVNKGDYISQNQIIGLSGSSGASTGPHLHFEIDDGKINDNPQGKYNPFNFLASANVPISLGGTGQTSDMCKPT